MKGYRGFVSRQAYEAHYSDVRNYADELAAMKAYCAENEEERRRMAFGPGKYDDLCTTVRELTNADTAIVVVVAGNEGSGFSVQTIEPCTLGGLPILLRMLADSIEADMTPRGAA